MSNDTKSNSAPEEPPAIDWSVIEKYPENTCTCRCGKDFRSHAKFDMSLPGLVSRKPCPGCGSYRNLFRASSDPETMTL